MNDHAISVAGLTKSFGPIRAVDSVSFEVEVGETFGFLGPNGAGKTTTISMLCTLLEPTAGSATVAGYDIVEEREAVRRRIGLVFQDPTVDDLLTGEQNLRFHGALYGLSRSDMKNRVGAVLEMVGLTARKDDLVRNYSGGMRRRLEIARGLLHSPRVLFLDEPTVGLDPQTRLHIWDYIDQLRRSEEITMFLTTHYLEEAERCRRIAIIDDGKIVAIDSPSALKAAVGRDSVKIRTDDNELAATEIARELAVEPTIDGDELVCLVPDGEAFVPRLFSALSVRVLAISTSRPTLDDVFIRFTGRAIRDAEADATEANRMSPWMRQTTRRSA